MINLAVKYFGNFFIISAYFTFMNTDDVFFHLGCYTSILLGFGLRLAQTSKKIPLTKKLVTVHAVITLAICWVAFIGWMEFREKTREYLMVYLFFVSFFAVIISEVIDKFGSGFGRLTLMEVLKTIARKYLLADDKEDKE